MELNQIRYFVVLAEELHFTRAAEACNVSQPALTKAIQKLEEELGGPLFLRERGRTQLTELGRLTRPSLERALSGALEAKTQAETFRRRESSPLRVGLEMSIPAKLLSPILRELYRECAQSELSMTQDDRAGVVERMLDGEIDVALLLDGEALTERLHRWPLFTENYVVIFPRDHPFGDRDAVPVEMLAEECLLMSENPDCPVRRLVLGLFADRGVKPRARHYLSSPELIVDMVLASLGVAVAGERLQSSPLLVQRPIAPDPGQRHVMLAAAAGRPLGPTAGLFIKLTRAHPWRASAQVPGSVAA